MHSDLLRKNYESQSCVKRVDLLDYQDIAIGAPGSPDCGSTDSKYHLIERMLPI
jgi:hypothetical protein